MALSVYQHSSQLCSSFEEASLKRTGAREEAFGLELDLAREARLVVLDGSHVAELENHLCGTFG